MKHHTLPTITAFLAAGALLAGCGSGSSSSSSGQTGKPSAASVNQFQQKFVAFAQCMRSHGVPDYPDPQFTASGVRISPGQADPNSPAFKSAQGECRHLLPNGGNPVGLSGATAKAQEVKFADCMRAHSVPNFPDPSHDGAFDLPAGLNPQAPQFTKAVQDCKSVQPGSLSINQSAGN